MIHGLEETEEFVRVVSALSINIGTLSTEWGASMKITAKLASELGKPWVLDPVAVGATTTRLQLGRTLLEYRPTVVRGNASEISALAGRGQGGKGVDSTHEAEELVEVAKDLARQKGCVVAMTGKVDVVTDGVRTLEVSNGHAMLQKVTAAGCSLSSVVAAFLAANPELAPVEATAAALAIFGLAAEKAFESIAVKGPGSFRAALLDTLHLLTGDSSTLLRIAVAHGS